MDVTRWVPGFPRAENHREHTPQPDLSSERKLVLVHGGSSTFFQCARWRSFTEDFEQVATNDPHVNSVHTKKGICVPYWSSLSNGNDLGVSQEAA